MSDSSSTTLWHLANSPIERELAEFELALICLAESFYRLMREHLSADLKNNVPSGEDNVILQAIYTRRQPKSVSDLCRLLNRDDTANVQYSLRKLRTAGLISKLSEKSRKGTLYQITAEGAALAERFVVFRRELIVDTLARQLGGSGEQLHRASQLSALLTGIYDNASRILATRNHRT